MVFLFLGLFLNKLLLPFGGTKVRHKPEYIAARVTLTPSGCEHLALDIVRQRNKPNTADGLLVN